MKAKRLSVLYFFAPIFLLFFFSGETIRRTGTFARVLHWVQNTYTQWVIRVLVAGERFEQKRAEIGYCAEVWEGFLYRLNPFQTSGAVARQSCQAAARNLDKRI
jgi:hypothetical protein